jgi:hypothetical protein
MDYHFHILPLEWHIEKPSSSQKDRVLGQIDEKIVVKVENDSNKKKEEVHSTRVVERREERV